MFFLGRGIILVTIIYWGIASTIGFISMGLYSALYLLKRNKQDLNLLIFNLNITGVVATNSIITVMDRSNVREINLVGFFAFLFSVLLIYTLPKYSHSTRNRANYRNKYFLICSILMFLYLLYSTFIYSSNYYPVVILMVMGVAIMYSMIYMILPMFREGEKRTLDPSMKRLGILTIIFLPIMFILDFFPSHFMLAHIFKNHVLLFPGFYIVLNIGFIISARHSFISQDKNFDQFYNKYGISKREAEVFKLLYKGLSYQEIGEELHISHSTVKTHISRLYQKCEVKNKVEIIALVR